MLISLRVWKQWWDCASAMVAKSDSKAALGAYEKARSKSAHINVIAREFAFDVALATYEPQFVFEHVRVRTMSGQTLSLAWPCPSWPIPRVIVRLMKQELPVKCCTFCLSAEARRVPNAATSVQIVCQGWLARRH